MSTSPSTYSTAPSGVARVEHHAGRAPALADWPGACGAGGARPRRGRRRGRRRPARRPPRSAPARRSSGGRRAGASVALRTASTTSGPMVMLGTKRPSITSTWIQSAPAASTARDLLGEAAEVGGEDGGGDPIGGRHGRVSRAALPSRAAKKPSAPCRCGSVRRRSPLGVSARGAAGAAASARRDAPARAGTPRPRPRSPRAAASTRYVDERPPGLDAPSAGRRMARCVSARRAGSSAARRASSLRVAPQRAEAGAGRVDEHASKPPRRDALGQRARRRAHPRHARLARRSRRAVRRTQVETAFVAVERQRPSRTSPRARRCAPALPPGAAHTSSTRSPAAGASSSTTSCDWPRPAR